MANDAIIRYDGSKKPFPPPPIPSAKIAAEKLRELLLDIVDQKLAEIMITVIDETATDHQIPTGHAAWDLKRIILNEATEATEVWATKAESYAVGGTGTRQYEDIDNAKYYSIVAQQGAGEAGYLYFFIDENGDLIMDKMGVVVNFFIDDGDLYVEEIA